MCPDNAKSAMLNAVCSTHETITCIAFDFAAVVARIFLVVCLACNVAMPALAIGLDSSGSPSALSVPPAPSTDPAALGGPLRCSELYVVLLRPVAAG